MSGRVELDPQDLQDLATFLGELTKLTTRCRGVHVAVYGSIEVGKDGWNLPLAMKWNAERGYFISESVGD